MRAVGSAVRGREGWPPVRLQARRQAIFAWLAGSYYLELSRRAGRTKGVLARRE